MEDSLGRATGFGTAKASLERDCGGVGDQGENLTGGERVVENESCICHHHPDA